jgi:hypothetical protein
LTQTARNSANAPLVMHWRKWTVKFKVGEREFYYCLFTDLDEAKRVCVAARFEHDPKARARDNSTTHLTDAEIAERFAFDNNNDPVWRDNISRSPATISPFATTSAGTTATAARSSTCALAPARRPHGEDVADRHRSAARCDPRLARVPG